MALEQKRRTKTISTEQKNATWSSVFPESLKTEQKSLLFVKKLVTVGISTITYLRGVFPEDAYGDKCCEGLNLKILLDDETCPEVSTLIKWIKGSFDAIQKKYLRQMTFALSSSNDPDEPALETYTFRFGYSDGLATVESITSSAKKGFWDNTDFITFAECDSSNSECDVVRKIKRPTLKMLRTIILLTESLADVPRNAFLSMRLLYYDDYTPDDYHPEGFTSGNLENYVFENKPTLMKVGAVNTGLHSLKLKIHTSYGFTSEDSDKQQTNESSADSAAELRQSSNEQRESREQPSTDHLLDNSADHLSQRIEETSLLAEDKENTIRRYSSSRSITRLPKILSPNDKREPLQPSPKYQEIETMSFTFSDKSLPDMAPSSVACHRNAFSSAELVTDGSETPMLCPALGNSPLVTPLRTHRANSGISDHSQVSMRSVPVYLVPNSPSKEYPVRCPCEVEADDGLMIQCDVCGYWQHGGCFSVLEEHRVPDRHICQLCSDDTFLCTDARLCTLSPDQLSLTCLLRRTLLLLRTRGIEHNNNQQHMVTTSSVLLAKRLGVTIAKAGTIITTLDEMGLIATKTNSGFCKVDGQKLETIIPMYFSVSKSQTPSVASVGDVRLESQEWTVQPLTKRQKVSISCPMDGATN